MATSERSWIRSIEPGSALVCAVRARHRIGKIALRPLIGECIGRHALGRRAGALLAERAGHRGTEVLGGKRAARARRDLVARDRMRLTGAMAAAPAHQIDVNVIVVES